MFKMIVKGEEYYIDGKPLDVGDKIVFSQGRRLKNTKPYTCISSNKFFAVCTQPLNMIKRLGGGKYKHTKTVMYTVIDWLEWRRGTENLIFGMGAETKKDCDEMLARLTNGESEVSHRNTTELSIEKIIRNTQ